MSYIDALNKNILNIILTKIPFNDIEKIESNSYEVKKYLSNDSVWQVLLKMYNIDFYNFINNVRNIDGCDTWKHIYNPIYGSEHTSDLRVSYDIYKEFPAFYNEIKDINLEHKGISFDELFNYTHVRWVSIYDLLKTYKDFDYIKNFPQLNPGYEKLFTKLGNDIRYHPKDTGYILFSKLLFYTYYKKFPNQILVRTLWANFQINFDIYERLISNISNEILNSFILSSDQLDPVVEATMTDRQRYFFELFVEDIKKRLIS